MAISDEAWDGDMSPRPLDWLQLATKNGKTATYVGYWNPLGLETHQLVIFMATSALFGFISWFTNFWPFLIFAAGAAGIGIARAYTPFAINLKYRLLLKDIQKNPKAVLLNDAAFDGILIDTDIKGELIGFAKSNETYMIKTGFGLSYAFFVFEDSEEQVLSMIRYGLV